MFGREDDKRTFGVELFHQGICNLGRQALLHLEAMGIALDEPPELREAADPSMLRQIDDRSCATERQDMVLTEGLERDVAHDDEFI